MDQPIGVANIKAAGDPMTPEERDEIRRQLRAGSEALARFYAEHGDAREEWAEMFGSPCHAATHDAA